MRALHLLKGQRPEVRHNLALDQLPISLGGFRRDRNGLSGRYPGMQVIGNGELGWLNERAAIPSYQQAAQFGLRLLFGAFECDVLNMPLSGYGIAVDLEFEAPTRLAAP